MSKYLSGKTINFLSAVVTVFVTLFAMIAAASWKFNPTAYIHLADSDPLAALAQKIDPTFTLVNGASHYDGVYYYAMALDPFATGQAHTLIDLAPYRYGHPLHGWLAALLSFGNNSLIPLALAILSLIGVGLGSYYLSKLAEHFGLSPWWGIAFAAHPGILFSSINSTTEPIGLALILMLIWFYLQKNSNIWILGALSILLCLDKEQYVLIVASLAFWDLWQRRNNKSSLQSQLMRFFIINCGIVVLAIWYLYVHSVFGQFPNHYGEGVFGLPFLGWIAAFKYSVAWQSGSFDQSQMGTLVIPMLTSYLVIYGVAISKLVKMHNVIGPMALGQIVISFCHGWLNLTFPHEIMRDQAISLFLALMVIIIPREKPSQRRKS